MNLGIRKEIFIFRHGETDWNKEGRFQGSIDIPLNEAGRKQAEDLIPQLASCGIEAILSSNLTRAIQTAEIIAQQLKVPVFQDAGLREAHLGKAEGLMIHEIQAQFGTEIVSRWRSHHLTDADISYPGGETGVQVMERAFQALQEFLLTNPFQRIGVASHGGVIRRVMQRILPPGSDPVPIPNGVLYSLTFCTKSNDWRLFDFEKSLGSSESQLRKEPSRLEQKQ